MAGKGCRQNVVGDRGLDTDFYPIKTEFVTTRNDRTGSRMYLNPFPTPTNRIKIYFEGNLQTARKIRIAIENPVEKSKTCFCSEVCEAPQARCSRAKNLFMFILYIIISDFIHDVIMKPYRF